ncbi:MAG: FitA-like ribbon-helix-helix domain-containing protein [Acetobacteraceae bacterium]
MATLVIRNVDETVHARLKTLAASHGRSMEEGAAHSQTRDGGVPVGDTAALWTGYARDL